MATQITVDCLTHVIQEEIDTLLADKPAQPPPPANPYTTLKNAAQAATTLGGLQLAIEQFCSALGG